MSKPGWELDALVATEVMNMTVAEMSSFCPSTDIDDAWMVLEKIGKMYPVSVFNQFGSEIWWCEVVVSDELIELGAETAPLAICLAALKAVGYEKPQETEETNAKSEGS